jgi:hypothetical protein
MPDPDDNGSSGQTAQRVTVGAGVILGVLGVAGTLLDKVPLRVVVLVLAILLLTVVTALVHAGFASRSERAATRNQAEALRDMLSSWPLRTPGDMSAYALGVRSPAASVTGGQPAPQYVSRDVDPQVQEALTLGTVVLLVGPPCAGKSRTALHAVGTCERTQDARVIAPDDAQALRKLLRYPDWVIDPGGHYILWLDDLDRYLSELHLRALDAFVRTADRDRSRAADVGGVVVIATLREDAFRDIFRAGGDRAHTLRGFIARAERIYVPLRLSADELARLAEAYPDAPEGESFAEIFGETMVQLGYPLYTPPQPSATHRARRRSLPPIVAGLTAVVLVLLLAYVGLKSGWVNPPPMSERFSTLDSRDDPCGGTGMSPTTAEAVRGDVVRVVHRGDGCAESDLVEIYRRDGNTLAAHRAAALQAVADPKRSFHCLGPDRGDPCHPDIFGNKRVIVGGLVDSTSTQLVSVAIYPRGDKYVPKAIHLAPARGVARASSTSPAIGRASGTIRVTDRETHHGWTLQGSPVAEAVMLAPRTGHGATLVAAYHIGTLNRPALIARGYELRLDAGEVSVAQICDGRRAGDLRYRFTDTGDLGAALRRRYVRAATAGRVRCEVT